jgi:hypothetical protein
MAQWIQKADSAMKAKGTKGLFGRKAKAAGMSTQAYASKKSSAPGKLGKEARFAKAMGSIAKGK